MHEEAVSKQLGRILISSNDWHQVLQRQAYRQVCANTQTACKFLML